MERIIPTETYKLIEAKLHNRDEIEFKIEKWRLSVKHPENKQYVRGKGYISDPTANQAIKFSDPPEYIKDCEKWIELIDMTRDYCQKHGNRIFDIWYGKEKQSVTRAYTRSGMSKPAFKRNRNNAVYFLLVRAINAGLCRIE